MAPKVNFVWNYINELSYYMLKNRGKFISAYDMHPYLVGSSRELELHSHTIQAVAEMFSHRRKLAKKAKLKFRKSSGRKRSLGWVPFKTGSVTLKEGYLYFNGYKFKVFDSYGLENYKFRSGSFNQDSKGDWYLNIIVDVDSEISINTLKLKSEVGIDLGLNTFATLSNGVKIRAPQFYREQEARISMAKRANKKKLIKSLHKKVQNRRKDFLHKLSTNLVKDYTLVVVGSTSSKGLEKLHGKSLTDAAWFAFKYMLEYKAIKPQTCYINVNEAYTSVTCSSCNGRTGPSGLGELRIREWTCSSCGSVHDRDINAAKNILALGHQSLAEGAKL